MDTLAIILALQFLGMAMVIGLIAAGPALIHHARVWLWHARLVCIGCLARRVGLPMPITREHLVRHKSKIHFGILALIAWDLIHVGAKLADLGFLFLSLMIEGENKLPPDVHTSIHANKLLRLFNALPLIPHADMLISRLDSWAKARGWTRIPWNDLGPKQRAFIQPTMNGLSWGTFYSTRNTVTPTQNVYLTLHELSHMLSQSVSDWAKMTKDRKAGVNVDSPCWVSMMTFVVYGLFDTVRSAKEYDAESINLRVHHTMGWDDTLPRAYLDNYDLPTADYDCLAPSINRNAATLVSVLKGEINHAPIL